MFFGSRQQDNPSILGHFGKVIQSGSGGFGFSFHVNKPIIPSVFEHVKKFIPGGVREPSKRPYEEDFHEPHDKYEPVQPHEPQRPPYKPHERPSYKPNEEQRPPYKPHRPNKPENSWKPQNPKEEELPQWEDIGEEPLGEDGVPIGEIIQPRRRPKRFIDSKIYHVALNFKSNAKPYQVKIGNNDEQII